MKGKPIHLRVLTRGELLYEGEVNSLSSINESGKFDVLPKHANFISLIKNHLIIREQTGDERQIKVEQGILRVFQGRANVYLGIKQ